MYQKRTPKTQAPYKSVYVAHNPHTVDISLREWPDTIRIISIDPGITHYAIRVEERNVRTAGPIKTLHFDKVGLKKDEQELSTDLVCPIYTFILDYLDKYLDLFKTCHMVIIEKQLPVNYRAVRMSQNTLTYFMTHLKNITPQLAMFFEIKPQLKGRELGAPPNLNERGIKLWAVEKARELLTDRNDQVGLKVLNRKDPITNRKEKKDDLSDTLCQIEALFSYLGWPLTQKIVPLSLGAPNSGSNLVSLKIVKPKETQKVMKLNIVQQT